MTKKIDEFVHLHSHTHTSILDGFDTIPELVAEVARLGQPAVAVTDHGSLSGIYELMKEARKHEVNPIAGIEAYMTPSITNRFSREPSYLVGGGRDDVAGRGSYTHLTILAENNTGLKNLFHLSQLASTEGFYQKPRVDFELLEKYHEGLIVTTSCPSGEVQVWLRSGNYDKARAYAQHLVDIFGKDSVFVELMDHGMIQDLERKVRSDLLRLAKDLDIGLLATNDLHYATKDDAPSHEEMLAIQTRAVMSEKPDYAGGNRFAFEGGSYYVKSAAEMAEVFGDLPEAISNTLLIAERASFSVDYDPSLRPSVEFPAGYDEDSWLRKESFDGLANRLPDKVNETEYIERLEKELRVLKSKGFSSYFLVVSDFIRWAKFRANPQIQMGPGRGSAAGSLIAYCLDITDADPIRHDLLFERFLNEERDSPPDIDIDVADRDRERLIQYVKDKYGNDQVALVTTFGRIKAKNSMKDIARIYEEPFEVGNRLSKALPAPVFGVEVSLADVYNPEAARYPEAKEFRDLVERDGLQHVVEPARKLEGRIRSLGVHAAAVIISNKKLVDYIPTYMRQADKAMITQWDYPTAEEMGLIKMDFLGLRNLGVLQDTVAHVKRTRGIELDLNAIAQGPMDDPKVYDLLQKGDTLGVFQLDGGGMRGLLKVLKATEFEDISAVLSLYRPGPMGVGADRAFALRKNGLEEVTPIHPEYAESLKDVLEPTYGLIIYQEQVQRIAQIVADYSLAEADLLRRAMGKKKRYIIDKEFETFKPRAMAKGYSEEAIDLLWNILVPFADYAFNKCLTGDATVLVKTESGQVVKMRIDDMFEAHRERSLSGRGIKVYAFDSARNNFYFDNLKDVMYNGRKDVVELKLASGRSIKSTVDHRHMTPDGMRRVSDLKVGDNLVVAPFTDGKIDVYNTLKMWSIPREASFDAIVSIEAAGHERTFDLEMHGVEHNYVANGVVTHNSHTVAYGIISYLTAYLKANFPAEYMAALLSSVSDNTDKTAEYLEDCRQHGIKVTTPDVNKSESGYVPVSPTEIAFGFNAVKGVGSKVADEIVEWRHQNGEFKSFGHFLAAAPKAAVNKRIVEALTLGGGFENLPARAGVDPETGKPYAPLSRAALYAGIEGVLKDMSKSRTKAATAARKKIKDAEKAEAEDREYNGLMQVADSDLTADQKKRVKALERAMAKRQAANSALTMFELEDAPEVEVVETVELDFPEADFEIEAIEEWGKLDKLKLERTVLGLYISGHPLDELDLDGMASNKVADLVYKVEDGEDGEVRLDPIVKPLDGWPGRDAKPQRIAGIVTSLAVRKTKKGDTMATGVLEDKTGMIPFTVFPKTYSGDPIRGTAGFGELLKLDGVYQLTGFSRLHEEDVSFNVDALRPLEFSSSGSLSVRLKLTTGQYERGRGMLDDLFRRHPALPGRRTNVIVSLKSPDGKITEEVLDVGVNPSPALTQEIRAVFGMLSIGRWRSVNR